VKNLGQNLENIAFLVHLVVGRVMECIEPIYFKGVGAELQLIP
jgi:hypothetical protein